MEPLPMIGGIGEPDLPAPAEPASRGIADQLSKREKAAIVVRFLLAEGASISLADLPDSMQDRLTRDIGEMGYVDRDTVAAVVEDFMAEIDAIGLSFPRGLDGALSIISDSLSPTTARRLRKDAGPPKQGDPWPRIAEMDPEILVKIIDAESIEVAAVILSMLPVDLSARLLGIMAGERARRITYAISLTEDIGPDAVRTIGFSLASMLEARPGKAFETPPVSRVGAILNVSRPVLRDDVLEGLDETDADFAAQVRKAIFTYENIPSRVSPGDVPKMVREIDRPALITAMAGAATDEAKAVGEFILGGMSKRLAQQIRDEIDEMGAVKEEEVEEAMSTVTSAIRTLVDAGEIFLVD